MYIALMDYILSPTCHSVFDIAEMGEITRDQAFFYQKMMGLNMISRFDRVTPVNLLSLLLDKIKNKIESHHVKYVLLAHTADYIAPQSNLFYRDIKQKYHFNNAIIMGSTLNKCASAFHWVALSQLLFETLSELDCILVLMVDTAFTVILKTIPGSTILGDAAAAILLQKKSDYHRVIDACLDTYGAFSKGSYATLTENLLFQSSYVNYLCYAIETILCKNNIALKNIALIFPHNVNVLSWRQVMRQLCISNSQIYLNNIKKTGHCFGADPFINLQCAINENLIVLGDYYLLVTVGLGATFSVILMQY